MIDMHLKFEKEVEITSKHSNLRKRLIDKGVQLNAKSLLKKQLPASNLIGSPRRLDQSESSMYRMTSLNSFSHRRLVSSAKKPYSNQVGNKNMISPQRTNERGSPSFESKLYVTRF